MFYLVIVVTNKQTNRQTNAGDSIIPRESFRGDNKYGLRSVSDSIRMFLKLTIRISKLDA